MILSHSPVSETFRERIEAALAGAYGIQVEALDRLHAGTATDNLQVRATDGQEWFVKLHATHSDLDAAGEAIELADIVRGGVVPVPIILRTLEVVHLYQASYVGSDVLQVICDAAVAVE